MGFFSWDRRRRIRNLAEEKDLFILQDLHIGSGVQPASVAVDIGLFPKVKTART